MLRWEIFFACIDNVILCCCSTSEDRFEVCCVITREISMIVVVLKLTLSVSFIMTIEPLLHKPQQRREARADSKSQRIPA